MEKFWKIVYYGCLSTFVFLVTYLTVMLFISPRQDALHRGFIPCTQKLVVDMYACESGEVFCPLKFLWQDTKCNVGVVFNGFGAWVKGEQKTPWANYLFEPKALAEIDEELPYPGNVKRDAAEMKSYADFMKEKQDELEEIKNRRLDLNESVIMFDPEEEIPAEDIKAANQKIEDTDIDPGDISEEVFEEIITDETDEQPNEQPNQEEKKDEK